MCTVKAISICTAEAQGCAQSKHFPMAFLQTAKSALLSTLCSCLSKASLVHTIHTGDRHWSPNPACQEGWYNWAPQICNNPKDSFGIPPPSGHWKNSRLKQKPSLSVIKVYLFAWSFILRHKLQVSLKSRESLSLCTLLASIQLDETYQKGPKHSPRVPILATVAQGTPPDFLVWRWRG